MSEILNFLNEAKVFYLATIEGDKEGDKPRVRPFGFTMEFEDKLYFCTSESKPSFGQLNKNPNLEISTTIENKGWVRISGEAVFDTRSEVTEKIFETAPQLKDIYGKPDSPVLKPFYIKNGEAIFSSMTAAPRVVKF